MIKLQKPQKLHNRKTQNRLQMSMINKVLKKKIYISRRNTKNEDDVKLI